MRFSSSEPKATTVTVITVITMTENNQTAAGADAPGGLPFYEQSRTQLKTLLAKRRDLERKLVSVSATSRPRLLDVPSSNNNSRCRPTSKKRSITMKQSISNQRRLGTS